MSRSIVESLAPGVIDSLDKIKKLTEACPDNLLNEKSGGWPVWQHIVHAVSASDFFTPGPSTAIGAPLPDDVIHFKTVGTQQVPKKVLLDYCQAVAAKVETFLKGLNDEDLTKPNENTAKIGLKWNLGRTLLMLTAHPYYHLGYGDAVLRNNGLAGIF